jgi:hypothetical protein
MAAPLARVACQWPRGSSSRLSIVVSSGATRGQRAVHGQHRGRLALGAQQRRQVRVGAVEVGHLEHLALPVDQVRVALAPLRHRHVFVQLHRQVVGELAPHGGLAHPGHLLERRLDGAQVEREEVARQRGSTLARRLARLTCWVSPVTVIWPMVNMGLRSTHHRPAATPASSRPDTSTAVVKFISRTSNGSARDELIAPPAG